MTRVVRDGTGRNAAIPAYDVAGKTGTAQKMDPATRRYSRAPGVLSFVGFVPAEDARLAMVVLLDEPKNEKWGSEAAAPIFAAIAREALRHLSVPPRDTRPVQLVHGDRADAGGAVLARWNAGPAPALAFAVDSEDPTMPALTGRSLRDAMKLLAALDVKLEVRGRGVVIDQHPTPGSPLLPGTRCRLSLAPPVVAR
jgi:cell division protein FtsI (penicillin-binding protein 3)